MGNKELIKSGITLCQHARKNMIKVIQTSMNPLVLKSLGLSKDSEEPKLPYDIDPKDPPIIAFLKGSLNHFYHSEAQLKAGLEVLDADLSKIGSKLNLVKHMLSLVDFAQNAVVLTEAATGLGRMYQVFLQPELDALQQNIAEFSGTDLDIGALKDQLKSRLNRLNIDEISLQDALSLSGDLSDYAQALMKAFPEQLALLKQGIDEIKSIIFGSEVKEALTSLVSKHLILLRELEYKSALKVGMLTEPYTKKLFDMIPSNLSKEQEEKIRQLIGSAITDAHTQSKIVSVKYLESAHSGQVKSRFAEQFFNIVERLPSNWRELQSQLPHVRETFEALKTCYAQIRPEIIDLNPDLDHILDLDHIFITLIQGGELPETANSWGLKDFLDYKDHVMQHYESAYRSDFFSYQSYQESLSIQERDQPPGKLYTREQLSNAFEQAFKQPRAKDAFLFKQRLAVPAAKPVSLIEDKEKITTALQEVQKKRAELAALLKKDPVFNVLKLDTSTLPYAYEKKDTALVRSAKAVMNSLYHSEQLLKVQKQILDQAPKRGISSWLKLVWLRCQSIWHGLKVVVSGKSNVAR